MYGPKLDDMIQLLWNTKWINQKKKKKKMGMGQETHADN